MSGELSAVLTLIDDLTRSDHSFLTTEDECYYLGEYTARQGYQHSETNDLIQNLKKPADRRGRQEWKWKEAAIAEAGRLLRASLNPEWLATATIVPMPPSKAESDPLYDDRMVQVAKLLSGGSVVRRLIAMKESCQGSHEREDRPRPEDLLAMFKLRNPKGHVPSSVGILDDVLTTGSHFVAAKRFLRMHFGADLPVFGIFIARRAIEQ